MQVLRAAYRRDIRVIASRLLAAEVGRFRADKDRVDVDQHVLTYLESVHVEWWEVDLLVSKEARKLSWRYNMAAGPDSVHLATAVLAEAEYFISNDNVFPYAETIGKTQVVRPCVFWDPTTEDEELEQAHAETQQPRPSED